LHNRSTEEPMADVQQQQAQPKASAPKTGTDTVTVALKHPTGITIERFEKMPITEDVVGGGKRETFVFKPTGERFTINGNEAPVGKTLPFEMSNGYALTPGVPRDLWEHWLAHHKDSPLVVNGLIYASDSRGRIEGATKEGIDRRTGLERLSVKDDPRTPKHRTRSGKFEDVMQPFVKD